MRRRSMAIVLTVSVVTVMAAGVAAAARLRMVRVLDQCEPVTFNFFVMPGTCLEGGGKVTFGRFLDALLLQGGHPTWKFTGPTKIKPGDTIEATNLGGEFHTFTEVAAFGPGVVPDLNGPLGLVGPPVPECADPATFGATSLPQGASLQVIPGAGTRLFQCCIHPWMTLEIAVN